MARFGDTLRSERESRSISLDEIADATKIGKRYLDALEGERFAELPGGVFNKGYVRAYATFIGIDPDAAVVDYIKADHGHTQEQDERQQDVLLELARAVEGRKPQQPSALRTWVPVLVTALVVAAGVTGWLRWGPRFAAPASTTSLPPTASAPVEVITQPAVESPPVPAVADTGEPRPEERPPQQLRIAGFANSSPAVEPVDPVAGETVAEPELEETPPVDYNVDGPEEVAATAEVVAETVAEPDLPSMEISEHGVGTGVSQRALVGRADSFDQGTTVWFWNRILGGEPGDTVRHVWSYDGRVVASTELKVNAAHWRTQSRKTLRKTGLWSVEAVDAHGNVLARADFTCLSADSR
jgi:cytoskeletal protein RodZ